MTSNTMSSSTTTMIHDIHDFDVLADELPGSVYVMDDYKKQIGNNRFDVMIHMYQDGFNMNYSQNNIDECDAIVDKIVTFTSGGNKSSNNSGRFLVKPLHSINDWRELNDEESKQFVRQALRAPTATAMPEPEPLPDSHELEEEIFDPLPVSSHIDLGSMDIPSIDFENMELNDKKRGRRRSLLRRSVSESTMLLDKKKTMKNLAGELSLSFASGNSPPPTFRRYHSGSVPGSLPGPPEQQVGGLQRASTVASSIPGTHAESPHNYGKNSTYSSGGTIVPSFQGMDVVLSEDCMSLSTKPDIIGNNRLKVMLTLEGKRYMGLSPSEQHKIATDLVKAVTEFYHGRILVDQGFAYNILTHDEAVMVMKNLLMAPPAEAPVVGTSAAVRPPIFSSQVTTSSTASSSSASTNPSTKKPLLASAPQVPEFLRNASREILNYGRNNAHLVGPEQMQSAAVESIKKRAEKRQMAKGLGSSRNNSTTSSGGEKGL